MRAFDPWIGSRYATDGIGGKRLLILGEAHYGIGATYPAHTSDIIRNMALRRGCLPFFARVQHLVLGGRGWLSDADRQDFWQRVAYYNFIQTFPGAKSRIRPSPAMWTDAREPFLQTLMELSPHIILVLGKELSNSLPPIPPGITVCAISHPSSAGFSYAAWQHKVQSAISAANAQPCAASAGFVSGLSL